MGFWGPFSLLPTLHQRPRPRSSQGENGIDELERFRRSLRVERLRRERREPRRDSVLRGGGNGSSGDDVDVGRSAARTESIRRNLLSKGISKEDGIKELSQLLVATMAWVLEGWSLMTVVCLLWPIPRHPSATQILLSSKKVLSATPSFCNLDV